MAACLPLARGLLAGLALLASACAGHLSNGVFSGGATRYRIGEVPSTWALLPMQGCDIAFLARDSPHAVSINATCADHSDPSLEVLTRHLLMGFTDEATLTQGRQQLDGREALRSHVIARLDGVPVELILVVMKKDRCVYDFTYLSPVGRLDERISTFEQILRNFRTGAPT